MEEFLHIEDDDQYVEFIKDILHAYYPVATRVIRAQSLQEGLDILRNPEGEKISLVLLDLGLMDTTGPQSIRALFEAIPNKPVIVVTRNENENLRIQALRAGAQDYLIKDKFSNEQLKRALQHALLRFDSQSELRTRVWEMDQAKNALQNLLCLNKIAAWEMDIIEQTMYWEKYTYESLGYSPHSLPNPKLQDYLDVVSGEDQDRVRAFFQKMMQHSDDNNQTHILEHQAIVNGKNIRHFCLRGKLQPVDDGIKLIGSVQDITDQKIQSSEDSMSTASPGAKSARIVNRLLEPMLDILHRCNSLGKQAHDNDLKIKNLQHKLAALLDIVFEQLNEDFLRSNASLSDHMQTNLQEWTLFINDILKLYQSQSDEQLSVIIDQKLLTQARIDRLPLFLLTFNLVHLMVQTHSKLELDIHLSSSKKTANQLIFRFLAINNTSTAYLHKLVTSIQHYQKKPVEGATEHQQRLVLGISKLLLNMNGAVKWTKNNTLELVLPVQIVEDETNTIPIQQSKVLIAVRDSIVQFSIKQKMYSHFEHVELDTTQSLADALSKMQSEHYDVAIVDTQLPNDEAAEHNGIETIRKMKSVNGTPIIAMLPDANADYQATIAQAGAYACIATPPRSEELLEILSPLLKVQN